jgi:hypothetical protein
MEQAMNDSGWRGSQEGWLEAAYEALLESGVDSVKILAAWQKAGSLADQLLLVLQGSGGAAERADLRWRDKNTGNIVKQSEAYAESLAEAMLNVFDCWLDKDLFDSKFEFAVRSWALQSPRSSG